MTIELCPPQIVQKLVEESFDDLLLKDGFEKVKPLKYVRSRLNEMHDVIKFKGEHVSLLFTWGLSLKFVPHITMGVGDIRWHRTARSASMDLIYSGFHRDGNDRGFRIRTIQGKDALRDDAVTTRDHLLPRALQFFSTVKHTSDLEALFQREEVHNEWGAKLSNLPQVALAYSFYLAKSGQEQKAALHVRLAPTKQRAGRDPQADSRVVRRGSHFTLPIAMTLTLQALRTP
jgi:hypothetical protein